MVLRTGLSYAVVGNSAVFLDVMADRYFRLSPELTQHLQALEKGNDKTAELVLEEAGLLDRNGSKSICPVRPSLAEQSILEMRLSLCGKPSLWKVASLLAKARINLKIFGLARTLSRLPNPYPAKPIRTFELLQIAQGFVAQRRLVPFAASCLPDSIALYRLLHRAELAAELVLGVRLEPFSAHSWVEAGPVILSDSLDNVRRFTPVFRR